MGVGGQKTFSSSENKILPTRLGRAPRRAAWEQEDKNNSSVFIEGERSPSPSAVAAEEPGQAVKRRKISRAARMVPSFIRGEKRLCNPERPARPAEGARDAHPVPALPGSRAGVR